MGTGVTEITLAQLPGVIGRYSSVLYMNDPSDTDLIKTVAGHPRTLIINLGQLLNIASGEIQGDALAADELLAAQIGPGGVGTSELATDALAASVAGRLKIATNYFDAATILKAITTGAFTEANVDDAFAAGAIDGSDRLKAASIGDDRMASSIIKEPGRIACGRADFAGVATPAITVTIGAVVYQEADVEDFPNGVWTNGATANDSAVSLAAAINGDTRAGNLYAAVVLTDTVFIFARTIGTAGNAVIAVSAGEPVVVENLIDGAAAAVKQAVTIMHTVTAAEVAVVGGAPEVLIPLPFNPTYFQWQVYDSTGGIYATEITARGTVTVAATPVPAYFKLANNGTADVQAGDIIRLVVVE